MLFKSLVKINFICSNLFQDESLSGTQDPRRCFAKTFWKLNFIQISICLKTLNKCVYSLTNIFYLGRYFVHKMARMTHLGQDNLIPVIILGFFLCKNHYCLSTWSKCRSLMLKSVSVSLCYIFKCNKVAECSINVTPNEWVTKLHSLKAAVSSL